MQGIQEVGVIVLPAMAFSKIAGIGGHAAQAVFVDQSLQFAAGDQVAPNVVQPHRLAILQQFFQGISGFRGFESFDGFMMLLLKLLDRFRGV